MNGSLAPLFRHLKAKIFRRSGVRRHEGVPKHLRVGATTHANKLELAYLPVRVPPASPAVRPSSCAAACLAPSQLSWLPSRSIRSLSSGPLPRPMRLPQLGPALGLILLVPGYRAGGHSVSIGTQARGVPNAPLGPAPLGPTADDTARIPCAQSLCGLLVTIPSRRTRFGT
jgi:hypothetical protein